MNTNIHDRLTLIQEFNKTIGLIEPECFFDHNKVILLPRSGHPYNINLPVQLLQKSEQEIRNKLLTLLKTADGDDDITINKDDVSIIYEHYGDYLISRELKSHIISQIQYIFDHYSQLGYSDEVKSKLREIADTNGANKEQCIFLYYVHSSKILNKTFEDVIFLLCDLIKYVNNGTGRPDYIYDEKIVEYINVESPDAIYIPEDDGNLISRAIKLKSFTLIEYMIDKRLISTIECTCSPNGRTLFIMLGSTPITQPLHVLIFKREYNDIPIIFYVNRYIQIKYQQKYLYAPSFILETSLKSKGYTYVFDMDEFHFLKPSDDIDIKLVHDSIENISKNISNASDSDISKFIIDEIGYYNNRHLNDNIQCEKCLVKWGFKTQERSIGYIFKVTIFTNGSLIYLVKTDSKVHSIRIDGYLQNNEKLTFYYTFDWEIYLRVLAINKWNHLGRDISIQTSIDINDISQNIHMLDGSSTDIKGTTEHLLIDDLCNIYGRAKSFVFGQTITFNINRLELPKVLEYGDVFKSMFVKSSFQTNADDRTLLKIYILQAQIKKLIDRNRCIFFLSYHDDGLVKLNKVIIPILPPTVHLIQIYFYYQDITTKDKTPDRYSIENYNYLGLDTVSNVYFAEDIDKIDNELIKDTSLVKHDKVITLKVQTNNKYESVKDVIFIEQNTNTSWWKHINVK
jgi:hypothetical protein